MHWWHSITWRHSHQAPESLQKFETAFGSKVKSLPVKVKGHGHLFVSHCFAMPHQFIDVSTCSHTYTSTLLFYYTLFTNNVIYWAIEGGIHKEEIKNLPFVVAQCMCVCMCNVWGVRDVHCTCTCITVLHHCTVRAPVFGRHQFFGTSEHYGKAHWSLLSGWMNYNYTACCWFPTSSNILIFTSQFWQIRFESCWLHCSKCRILVLLRYCIITQNR